MRIMNATLFKATCLAVLDEVAQTGETVTILKHGKAVARLVPPVSTEAEYPQHRLRGTAEFLGDIVEPVVDDIGATLATRDRRIRESGLVDTA